jgi:DNA-3-methyladenine glycosylase I
MIKNKQRVQACIDNSHTFRSIVSGHGSFQAYVDSFSPTESFENLMTLKEEVKCRFYFLGPITSYQFLAQTGLPLLTPNRVICRIFQRLGLIENEKQLHETVMEGKKFSQATGHPMRYVDVIFALYGRETDKEFGLDRGICLENDPACSICGVTSYCHHYRREGAYRAI